MWASTFPKQWFNGQGGIWIQFQTHYNCHLTSEFNTFKLIAPHPALSGNRQHLTLFDWVSVYADACMPVYLCACMKYEIAASQQRRQTHRATKPTWSPLINKAVLCSWGFCLQRLSAFPPHHLGRHHLTAGISIILLSIKHSGSHWAKLVESKTILRHFNPKNHCDDFESTWKTYVINLRAFSIFFILLLS